jgi:pyridoxamine 5'-phosphate oxidase
MAASADRMFDESLLEDTPLPQFERWFGEAEKAGLPDFDAMTLATATAEGRPSARIVLLRGFDETGFTFFTNYLSRKGGELAANPYAALVFYWPLWKRQIRIEGEIAKVTAADSDAYFASRPRGHRLNALISPQSEIIPDRAFLDRRMAELKRQFGDLDHIPRPEHWGGYRLAPESIEFWQGRENRQHDRIRFVHNEDGTWLRQRLAP